MRRDSELNSMPSCGIRLVMVLCALLGPATPPAAGQTSPRDRRTSLEQTGTAVIRGRVLAGDTGKPLRQARLIARARELAGPIQNITTDADGRYEITHLPPGDYTIVASCGGYHDLVYGQRRPLERSKAVEIGPGQVVDGIDFTLLRMSVISGRVTDETGEPVAAAIVVAFRPTYSEGRRRLVPFGKGLVRTDDTGQYRVLGLVPGTYVVMAFTRDTWETKQNGSRQMMGYAPTYFPRTTEPAAARRLTLREGQEAGRIDIALIPGRTATISGTAVDSQGRPFANVALKQEVRGQGVVFFGNVRRVEAAKDGTFTLWDAPPGEYELSATRGGNYPPEVIMYPIVVKGIDIEHLALIGSPGATVTGRVIGENGIVPSLLGLRSGQATVDPIRVRVVEPRLGQPDPALLGAFNTPGIGAVAPDGSFTVIGVFGAPRLRVELPDGWAIKSVVHQGRDITDVPLSLKSGETLSDVLVTVTDRLPVIEGELTDAKGRLTGDGTVIVFVDDASKWTEDSRLVAAARPDGGGHWFIEGLPAGEYLAVAVDYVEEGQWLDPDYLESIRPSAQTLTLADEESKSIRLRLVSR
jgi:hypothetical protein